MTIDREAYSKVNLNAALRALTNEEVKFGVKFYTEDTPLEGNVQATEDAADDKKMEDEVYSQLQWGNMYAWCSVIVSASWSGFSGQASLGCCSYENEDAALRGVDDHGLKEEALASLNTSIARRLAALSSLLDGSGVGGDDEV